MKKFITSASLIVVFTMYTVYQWMGSVKYVATNPVVVPVPPTPSQTPVVSPKPTKLPSGYTDGTYTGNVADAYYGNVQVKAVIQNGQITDVQFLDHPQDRRTSIEINDQAMPILRSEAIQSQNANVDTVSGASDTSAAFRESLGNALVQAKA